MGKGDKVRRLPIPTDVDEALLRWERERPPELADDPLLFPRLGRPRRDNAFPDAGGKLSGQALSDIVKPIMLTAGVPAELAHPHVLRHTYARPQADAAARAPTAGDPPAYATTPRGLALLSRRGVGEHPEAVRVGVLPRAADQPPQRAVAGSKIRRAIRCSAARANSTR